MTLQSMRPTMQRRGCLITTLLTLTIALAACGGRFSLPGATPAATARPAAIAADQFNPSLTLSPPSGHAGLYVKVTGEGWPPNMMVLVVLSGPDGTRTTVASKDTDAVGGLVTGFLYPIEARWLTAGLYTVVAESADGQHQASAPFTVLAPGTDGTPVAVAPTATLTPAPIAAQPTATTASPTSTLAPTATPSPQPVVENSPAATAAPATSNQPPVVTAALIPTEGGDRSHQRYYVEVTASDPNENLRGVVALLIIPSLEGINDVKLKEHHKVEVRVNKDKMQISAPNPQAILDTIQQAGGIAVQPGQLIEYETSPDHQYKAEFDNDKLEIRASTLILQVTAIDAAGLSHQITASPPAVPEEEENRQDDSSDNDRRNDDRGDDNDDRGSDDRGGDDDDDNDDRDDD